MDPTNRNSDNPDKEPEDRLAKAGDECSDRDLVISRVVDGRAGAREWSTIESLAATDASIWREIAMAQRDQRALELLVSSAGSIAEATGLPRPRESEPAHVEVPRRRTGSWAGWAAAAAILLAYVAGVPLNGLKLNQPGGSGSANPINQTSLLPVSLSADEALANYLSTGKKEGVVLGEIPDKLLVEATPVTNGGFRVITIRQILEVHQVDNLLHFPSSRDEQGNLVTQAVPVTVRSSQAY
ncbi:MAG: hypothetical protein AABZ53_02350 [Planctomycetota bacterium]